MLPLQHEIEDFLIEDAGIGLSNVRAHLEWVSGAAVGEVRLSKESAASIIANLKRIEHQAERLSHRLIGNHSTPLGIVETLGKFWVEAA